MEFYDFINQKSISKKKEPIKENHIEIHDLHRGTMVKIIYKKDSNLNSYKGYFGEIKSCDKTKNIANVFLHASVQYRIIQFPIDHFQILEE